MKPNLLALLANGGIISFILIYVYASTLYDGGTKAEPHKKHWDWINNYWCDLIWPTTYLDLPNKASRWGILANSILCLSYILFFLAFAMTYAPTELWTYLIAISGTIAMICGMLIFSDLHDKVILIIIISVVPSVIGVVYGLIHFALTVALIWGVLALALVLVNVFIFYTKKGEKHLPLIQKIAYLAVLSWTFFINTTI